MSSIQIVDDDLLAHDKDFQALEDLVATEKAKKEKKVETVKPAKKTAKKSK